MEKPTFERRVVLLSCAVALPGLIVASSLLFLPPVTPPYEWAILGALLVFTVAMIGLLLRRVRFPLQTLVGQVTSLRDGDYTVRTRGGGSGDVLGELITELNTLGNALRERRLDGMESTALLHSIMDEIDVAVFAFDADRRLRLANRAGEVLLDRPVAHLLGRPASEIGLADCFDGPSTRVLDVTFGGRLGRWSLRRSPFREKGHPHQLLVLTDLSQALRDEERLAWKRLIRVMGHELNNSLAPIRSLTSSLQSGMERQPRPPDWEDDLKCGLGIIQSRAEALCRFMDAYARLARLPPPNKSIFPIRDWISRVASLESRLSVNVLPGSEVLMHGDVDQLEQLLINLIRNAVDAALESAASPDGISVPLVEISWSTDATHVSISIRDTGPGLPESANIFVPFFTTKPSGSGIGLALSRQITEAHQGSLTLRNRLGQPGAEALLQLPLPSASIRKA